MRSVIVVGAGVLGAAVAYHLAARGVEVTVVEAGEPAGETSRRSFAWLNGNDKPPLVYQQLNAEGIEAHRRLRDALGRGPWLHESGNLTFATDEAGARELIDRVERLRRDGYPGEIIDVPRAAALEPNVRFEEARAVAFFRHEAWAHGPTLVESLLEAARERGALVRTSTRVEAIESRSDGVRVQVGRVPVGVARWPRRAAGESPAAVPPVEGARETLAADALVVAAGRFADRVAGMVGFALPLAPSCGLLAVTSVVDVPPSHVVFAPGVHFRPDPGGRLVLQDSETDAMVGPETAEEPDLPGAALLLERARRYVAALATATVEAVRVGIRPMPADGYPVVGRLPGVESVYLLLTHSGLTLGPLLGEIAAGELLGGVPDVRLATFRPERYLVAT